MAILTKDQILKADDLKRERVTVREWGGDVYVATMTGTDRDNYESSIIEFSDSGKSKQKLENIRAKLVAATVVDEQGNRLFSDTDVAELGKKSAAALDRVFAVAQRLNAVSDSDVKDLAKN